MKDQPCHKTWWGLEGGGRGGGEWIPFQDQGFNTII